MISKGNKMNTQDLAKLLVNTLSSDSKISMAGSTQAGFGDTHEVIVDTNTGERFQITITQLR